MDKPSQTFLSPGLSTASANTLDVLSTGPPRPVQTSNNSEEVIRKMRLQMQASQVAAANNLSPLSPTALQSLNMPIRLGPHPEPGTETLSELLRMVQESPQPILDVKVSDAYRRSIPSSIPLGIDLNLLLQERERLQNLRIQQRIKYIESLLQNNENASGLEHQRTRLLIELKTLKLKDFQRKLRESLLRVSNQLKSVDTYVDRTNMRRTRKQNLRDVRLSEGLEHQRLRKERGKREKTAHDMFLQSVLTKQKELLSEWRGENQKRGRLHKQVHNHHTGVEREEKKKIEALTKNRMNALRADDEAAYLKLLDEKKDTRLTFLLKQTDSFLDDLSKKVRQQQLESAAKFEDLKSVMKSIPTDETDAVSQLDYYGTAHRIKEEITTQPSMLVGGQLKDYQMKGLQWMVSLYNNHLNGILADEMGLGKTIQTISLICYLVEKKGQTGPFLIIVPLSTMTNWSMEFEKWAPGINKIEYKGNPMARKELHQEIRNGKFNVLLTTYEYVIKDRPALSKINWLYLIVDEGHRMKNSHSKLTTVLTQHYSMKFRLILTGTPLQNNLPELWSLLNFLLPNIFNSCKSFEEWFNTPFANTGEKMELNEEEVLLVIRRLHKVLRPFLLRRMKKDVESELPDKVEVILKCPMSSLQQTLYNLITKRSASAIQDSRNPNSNNVGIRRLNNTIMQLRKICNHPFVFEEVEKQINPYNQNNELLYRVAGKFELLQRVLPKFKATGHKVLMFFQMTQIMTIMEDFLAMQGYPYLRLDGSTKAEDRSDLLKRFNAPDSPYFVFLLSTRAGGLGLNLQTADTVVIFDSDWNPHQDLQAQDRAHRIGQTKEVRIFRLITVESVEEYILERAQHKLNLDGKIIQAGKFDQKSTNEERDALLRAIMEREAEKEEDDDIYGDDELNEIIARNDQELAAFKVIDEEREKIEQQKFQKTGIRQSRLIDQSELPKVYLNIEQDVEEDKESDTFSEVRSSRLRTNITYNENISDAKWLAQLERGNSPFSTTSSSTVSRKRKKPKSDNFASETESSPVKAPRLKLKIPQQVLSSSHHNTSTKDSLDKDTRLSIIRGIFDNIENCVEAETNRYRSDLFLSLPDKKLYPDYYVLIKNPISLYEIESKLESYPTVHEFMSDLDLMFSNATQYNMEGSQVYEDAQLMKQMAQDKLEELMESEGRFGEGSDDDSVSESSFDDNMSYEEANSSQE